jgi:hypothetical protein
MRPATPHSPWRIQCCDFVAALADSNAPLPWLQRQLDFHALWKHTTWRCLMLWVHRPTKDIHSNWCDTTVTFVRDHLVHVLAAYAHLVSEIMVYFSLGWSFWKHRSSQNHVYLLDKPCLWSLHQHMDVQRYKFLMYDNSVLAVWWYHLVVSCARYTTWWVAKAIVCPRQ